MARVVLKDLHDNIKINKEFFMSSLSQYRALANPI